MRVIEVSYEMLRVTKAYENDRASVTIAVESGEDPQDVLLAATIACEEILEANKRRRAAEERQAKRSYR